MISFAIELRGMSDAFLKVGTIEKAFNVEDIADMASATVLSKVRARFMQQMNPDGKAWLPTKASIKRKMGIPTIGGDGNFHVGGGIYFSSGNLFHSIQLIRVGSGRRSIQTDVPYARYLHGREGRLLVGYAEDDLNVAAEVIRRRLG